MYSKNTSTGIAEVTDQSDYYPFGLKHNNALSINSYKENQYNVKELDYGGMYDYGARFYMPDIGRWGVVDPLADDQNQIDKSPYGSFLNNPITYDDPDGRCPWCFGAVVGAVVDYGLQVTINYAEGKGGVNAWTDVDYKSIAVSAGAGALSGGISSLSKVKNASRLVKAGVELATDVGVSTGGQAIENGKVSVKETLIDVGAGRIMGQVVHNAVKGSKIVRRMGEEVNHQKNIARGKSNTVPKSKANIGGAQKKLDNYVEKRTAAASTTASGVGTKIYDRTVNKNEQKKEK